MKSGCFFPSTFIGFCIKDFAAMNNLLFLHKMLRGVV